MYKMTFPSFVSTAVFLLCLLTACKKGNNEWPGPGGKDNCKCDVERFDVVLPPNYPGYIPFYHTQGCRFRKTYHPDGSLKQITAAIAGPLHPYTYSGYVKRLGNSVFMLDSVNMDTLLIVELNNQGRAITSRLKYFPDNRFLNTNHYTYDAQGKLIRSIRKEYSDYIFTYDQYGNLTGILSSGRNDPWITLEYDYNTPIKDAEYILDSNNFMMEIELLSYMGYIDFTPHHKLLSAHNYDYPVHTRLFTNQQINADGYVTSYLATLGDLNPPITFNTLWHCIKNNQHPKPSLH
jgi:YD repeat-containing protein